MIEKKDEGELYDEIVEFHTGVFNGDKNKDWLLYAHVLLALEEADNKLTPIQTKVALKRIIKELKGK